MATNLAIDQELLEEAVKVGGCRTKKEAVNQALAEYIHRRSQPGIMRFFGKTDWDPHYDYKRLRRRS